MATRIKAKAQTKTKMKPEPETADTPEVMPEAEAAEQAEASDGAEAQSSLGWSESEAAALEAELVEAAQSERAARIEQENPPHDGQVPLDGDGYIRREVWPDMMAGYFHLASAFTGLQTLKIEPGDDTYRQAALAVWDTARETPYMDYLIRPGGKWMQRVAAISAFALPVYFGCKAELAARRATVTAGPEAMPGGVSSEKPGDFGGM